MKTNTSISHAFRHGQYEIVAAVALVTTISGRFWIGLVALSLLATRAVMPRSNSVLYWPIGFASVLLASYAGSWYQWLNAGNGVDVYFAQGLFFLQIVFFYLIGHIRSVNNPRIEDSSDHLSLWQQLAMSIPSASVIGYATFQLLDKPFVMMGAYFGGGDHMNHAGMVYRLTVWTAGSGIKSPLNVYAVPDGIHYFVANLVGLASVGNSLTPITQVFLAAAWFEWFQAAAFVQLAMLLVVGISKNQWFFKFSIAVAALVLAMTVDRFVLQFMWAGFTTSLATCWLLLIPIAISRDVRTTFSKTSVVVGLVLLAYLAWIIYQPYSIPFVLLLAALTTTHVLTKISKKIASRKAIALPLALMLSFVVSLIIGLLIFGTDNDFVQRLSMSGATYKPYFNTVLFWCFLAGLTSVILILRVKDYAQKFLLTVEATFYLVVLLITATAIGLVIATSSFGLFDQPYYTQKMLWTLLFVSIPLVLSNALGLLSPLLGTWNSRNRRAFMLVTILIMLFFPITNEKYPVLASAHTRHNWIGRSLAVPTGLDALGEVAFSANDPQGTYIANLALQDTSQNALDTTISLSDNPYLVCRFISTRPIATVFTRTGGKEYLVDSGCPTNLLYIESGVRMEYMQPMYPQLNPENEINAITEPVIDTFLANGFRGSEGFIRWATGLRSNMRLNVGSDSQEYDLNIGFIMSDAATRSHEVTFRINGEIVLVQSFAAEEVGVVTLRDLVSEPNRNIDVQIDCDWREEEIWNRDLLVTPPKCFGITSLNLSTK